MMPHTTRSKDTRCRGAFTIVEVLVLLGITAALVGLLAPALSSARAGSRSTRCQTNLKQMAAAAHAYAALYDAFPTAIRYGNSAGSFRRIAWDWVTAGSQVVSPGALWGFVNNPSEVQQCPDFEPATAAPGGDPYTGYNYNTTYIGGEATFPQVGWHAVRKGIQPHACSRGHACAMFGDGGWKGGANKFMRAPLNSEGLGLSTMYAGGQAFRHRGATSVAFVDGHVGSTRDSLPGAHATDALLSQYMAYPRNGFLSNDDSMYDPR
ncbi:MAG TPA: DUF1559 domain-containing protein [Phycisphaerales bacterium]|nr:DUF1559 domain-containing protein [Phycisphaerales bacterium]